MTKYNTVRLPEDVFDDLSKAAGKEDRSKMSMARRAIVAGLAAPKRVREALVFTRAIEQMGLTPEKAIHALADLQIEGKL